MCKSGIPLKDVKSSEWNYSGIYKITNIVNGKCYIGVDKHKTETHKTL